MNRIDPAEVSLLVIAKEPLPGKAKTRLIPDLGPDGAAALATACLADTLHAVAEVPAHRRVLVLDGAPGDWFPDAGFEVVAQREGGLGNRLAGAFEDSGATPAVLVGMDTPQVNASLLEAAVGQLCEPGNDAVLGPASDGGWWAIGLRAANEAVFAGVPMSAAETCERQRETLTDLGLSWSELEQLRDIDTVEDARAVAAAAPWTRCAETLRRIEREGPATQEASG